MTKLDYRRDVWASVIVLLRDAQAPSAVFSAAEPGPQPQQGAYMNGWKTAIVGLATACVSVVFSSPAGATDNTFNDWGYNDYTGFCGDVQGGYVVTIQEFFYTSGAYTGNVDNAVGTQTNSAIIQYQTNHSLSADGCVGPATWREMQRHTTYLAETTDCASPPNQAYEFRYANNGRTSFYIHKISGNLKWEVLTDGVEPVGSPVVHWSGYLFSSSLTVGNCFD